MALSFTDATRLFQQDQLRDLASDTDGLRFLKLRTLSRRDHITKLYELAEVELPKVGARELFQMAFDQQISFDVIERCIREIYTSERAIRLELEPTLINQLYRLEVFDWGGLHQNSLERTIVNNYVKKIQSYDILCDKIDNELQSSLRGYVLSSWYNHWTSIVIEDIFRDHRAVLPAVGLVKKIDFFVNDVPFDLKVTYFPEGYTKGKRRSDGLRPELTLLKQISRRKNIPIPDDLPDRRLLEDLWKKVDDHPHEDCTNLIQEFKDFRGNLLQLAIDQPEDLIRWLYEHQGVRRFDAANRLFLVLVDRRDYFNSWKLKRAIPLLTDRIGNHLDRYDGDNNPGSDVEFLWQDGNRYLVTSDLIIITPD